MNHSNVIVELGKTAQETKVTVEGVEISNLKEIYIPPVSAEVNYLECMITVLLPVINTINDSDDNQ